MSGAIHLSPLEHILRWLVVGVGAAILLEFVWAAIFVPESRRAKTFAVVKIASSVIILGITINYVTRVPVVMPGALFYDPASRGSDARADGRRREGTR